MDYKMISADDHIDLGYLPRDLWEKRLPKDLVERGPHVETRDGLDFWVCDGETWGDWRGGAWWSRQKNRNAMYAQERGGVAEDFVLRPTIPELRLKDMERDNVEASVMFGPILPMQVADPELRHACISAYNDWLVEFCSAAPKQFVGVAMIPTDDGSAAAREVERARKIGLRQVNFLVGTVTNEIIADDSWKPFWDAAEDSDMVVSYHVGGGSPAPAPARPRKPGAFRYSVVGGAQSFYEPFVGLFAHGVLESHPKLRFVMAESGTGWIPFTVQEMDYRYRRALETNTQGAKPLEMLPSEVFKRQVWATYQEDRVGLELTNFFGEGHMMWASDYPHPDSTWPNSVATVEDETSELSPELKKQILRDNAKAFYGL